MNKKATKIFVAFLVYFFNFLKKKKMICRLRNIEGLSVQSIERRVEDGYKFIVYSYTVSMFLVFRMFRQHTF